MNPAQLYSVVYTLMADEVGGPAELERQFEEHQKKVEIEEYAKSPERFAPDRKVPEPVAEQMKEAMKYAAPAPLKKKAG